LSKRFYRWTRDLHLYFGLFVSPLLVVFAVSTFLLNHAWKPQPRVETKKQPIRIVDGLEDFAQVSQILQQLNVSGEVQFVRGFYNRDVVNVPVVKPGERTVVRIDRKLQEAQVERRITGSWDGTILLHVMPGPHKRAPNWLFMKIWSVFADTTVYLIFFLSSTGIYLWAVIKAERKAGLVFIGLGCASFAWILHRLLFA
jgi:hypothetical protein